MMTFFIIIHVIVCAALIFIILIQAGRGGGLVEGFSNMESMLGAKTNTFLTKATTILAVVFFLTCIGLALLSAQQSRSLIRNKPQTQQQKLDSSLVDTQEVPQTQSPESQQESQQTNTSTQQPVASPELPKAGQ
jgi:preprotein translocase subunit SecG